MGFKDLNRAYSVSPHINYFNLDGDILNLANYLETMLNNRPTGQWTVIGTAKANACGTNHYLEIRDCNIEEFHISFHMGLSISPTGSTHIKYPNNVVKRILVHDNTLIFENQYTVTPTSLEKYVLDYVNTFMKSRKIMSNKYL
jgi:hypothetical protein